MNNKTQYLLKRRPRRDLSMIVRAGEERGVGLVITLLILAIVSAIGSAILAGNMADLEISNNFGNRSVAFYAADSGVEAAVRDLAADPTWVVALVHPATGQVYDPMPDSLTINGTEVVPKNGGFAAGSYHALGATVQLGDGTYSRELLLPPVANIANSDGTITFTVLSSGGGGAVDRSVQVIRADVEIEVKGYGAWDNAIFAADGASGNLINGNVAVRGSVHIIGDPLSPPTISFSGTADIRNNYSDAASEFGSDASKLPALTPVEFNGETVESLETVIRLENGEIDLGGASDIGAADVAGNSIKETIDAVKTDGTVGPPGKVHADEWDSYDTTGMTFPSLDDPYYDVSTGTLYAEHRDFLDAVALEIPVAEISGSVSDFSYSDGANSITWDQSSRLLTIDGIVKVDGSLQIGKFNGSTSTRGLEYDGTGTLYATEDVEIMGAVVPSGNYIADGNLGLIAGQNIAISRTAQINVFAAIFAEQEIEVAKQTTIGGAMVSRNFDLGTNVPSVFQVPSLATNLPPGMPGSARIPTIAGARVANWFHQR